MQQCYINSCNHPLYQSFHDLYSVSFPIFEQRTAAQQADAFQDERYKLLAFTDDEAFLGFISYWEFDTYRYVEHFAVNAELRGRGYGSTILRAFLQATDKVTLLEIDPVVDSVSEARLRFYKRCGFQENPYPHRHPAYRSGYRPHPLVVLTAKRAITREEYQKFYNDLRKTVMKEKSTEYDKMLRGEVYEALDPQVLKRLNECKDLCWEYNQIRPTMIKERNRKLHEILGACDDDTFINQPFLCDFGTQIKVGKHFFANFNFVVLDEAPVTIGDDCFIGPNVSIYTACHSTDPEKRKTHEDWARPVTIGNDCWIGGSVTILPGVTIGDNVTIGAGSVVVKDIPSGSIAVGNPARVVKKVKY